MFKFIVVVAAAAAAMMATLVQALPGDIKDAAEMVHVPPEHRAAPPQPQQPQPPAGYPPGLSPFPRGAAFPPPVGGIPPQFPPTIGGGVVPAPQFPPLFFQTQNGFVPFASSYTAYRIQHATVPAAAVPLPQNPDAVRTLVAI